MMDAGRTIMKLESYRGEVKAKYQQPVKVNEQQTEVCEPAWAIKLQL